MSPGDLDDLPDDLQALADRLTCLGMEMAEHLRDAHRRFDAALPAPDLEEQPEEA